jgi:hypothetical protein
MKKRVACAILLFALTPCIPQLLAETIDVRIRIRQKKSEEKTITRDNLIKIQQFILQQGKTETYCNMYNNNPTYQTKNYRFYLNPDTGQENINCDPKKSKFHNLTIRKSDGGKNQYRIIEFLDEYYVYVTTNWPADDLTVQQIRQFVVDAIKEILAEIKKKEPNKMDAPDKK